MIYDFLYVFNYNNDEVNQAIESLRESIQSIKKSMDKIRIFVINTSLEDIRYRVVDLEDIIYSYFPIQENINYSRLVNRAVKNFLTSEYFFISTVNIIYPEGYIEKMTSFVEVDIEAKRPSRTMPDGDRTLGIIKRRTFMELGGYDESLKSFDFASQEFNVRIGNFGHMQCVDGLRIDYTNFKNNTNFKDEESLFKRKVERTRSLFGKDIAIGDLAVNYHAEGKDMGIISDIENGWRGLSSSQEHMDSKFWTLHNGERTLRLDYDLSEDSLVMDVGSYIGQWTGDIYNKYKCNILAFEPSREFYSMGLETFIKNDPMNIKGYLEEPLLDSPCISVFDFKIKLYEFAFNDKYKGKIKTYNIGLYDKTIDSSLYLKEDSSSMHGKDEPTESIKLVEFMEFVNNNNIDRIDLLKLNVEGAEFNILNNIINNDFAKNIGDIQVQFHKCYPDADSERAKLRDKLSKTHYLTYDYAFVWENWRLRK
jgi:FkbM family methyltransferase